MTNVAERSDLNAKMWEDVSLVSRHQETLALSASGPKEAEATLLMFPGFTSRRLNATNRYVGERIARLGIRCVAVDLSGHGDSEGKIEDQTILKAAEEIEDVVAWASNDFPLGILANSFSATAAILAARDCANVSCLALKSPVPDYCQMREAQIGKAAMARWRREGVTTLPDGTRTLSKFLDDAEAVDVYSEAASLPCSILAVHGELDEQIPFMQRGLFRDVLVSAGKEHVLISGGDHVLSGSNFAPTMDLLIGFLVRELILDR